MAMGYHRPALMTLRGSLPDGGAARRRILTRLVLVSAAAATMFPRSAKAQESQKSISAGLGMFVGFNFGPRQGIEWGFETFVNQTTDHGFCTNGPRSGLGVLTQFGIIGLRDP